jgi:hypothetical protein
MFRRIACGLSVLCVMASAPVHANGFLQRILGVGNQPQYQQQPYNPNYPQSYDGQGYSGQQQYVPNYPQSYGGQGYPGQQQPYPQSYGRGQVYSGQQQSYAPNDSQSYDGGQGYPGQQQPYPQANYGQRPDMDSALAADQELAREAQRVAIRIGHAAWRSRSTNASGIAYVETSTPAFSPDGVSVCRMVREEIIDARGRRHDNRGQVCVPQ